MAGVENGWKSLPALEFQDTDSGNMATTIPQRTGKREDQAIATHSIQEFAMTEVSSRPDIDSASSISNTVPRTNMVLAATARRRDFSVRHVYWPGRFAKSRLNIRVTRQQ